MAAISYAAEGVLFKNHEFPYFFRTIGENRQYEQVYVRLLKELSWHRVVAFTEDGQKYTEYILQLENVLKENGIELTNKKFSKYFGPAKFRNVSWFSYCCKSFAAKVENSFFFGVAKFTIFTICFFFSMNSSHCKNSRTRNRTL